MITFAPQNFSSVNESNYYIFHEHRFHGLRLQIYNAFFEKKQLFDERIIFFDERIKIDDERKKSEL